MVVIRDRKTGSGDVFTAKGTGNVGPVLQIVEEAEYRAKLESNRPRLRSIYYICLNGY